MALRSFLVKRGKANDSIALPPELNLREEKVMKELIMTVTSKGQVTSEGNHSR